MMDSKTIIAETDKYYLPVFSRYKVAFTHGKGCYLYDAEGKAYLDFLGGIAVNALGYAHPVLVKALSEQAAKLTHCSNIFYTDIQAKAVKLISEVTGFDRVFLANSGAEANEGAMKLARKYGVSMDPCKFKIISADESFHGRTFDTLAATGHEHYRVGYGPLPPGHEFVHFGDLKELEAAMDDEVCAVLLEPIQGEGGVHPATKEYLEGVRKLCDKYKALLMFDEVQCGVCRSGKWFAYMLYGVKPDVMTFAKGIGGGFPMGGFCVDEKYAHVFAPGDHGSTFGGNAIACAATFATLSTLKSENMADKVVAKGKYFKEKLQQLQEKHPDKVKEVRGTGLLLGMELTKKGSPVVESCLADGLIVNCTAEKVIRLVPPLIVTEAEIDKAVAILDKALTKF
jgi:acetylornithine/N-succinyldiaminopimelate aminotransferase